MIKKDQIELKKLAHNLKPIFQVGSSEIHESNKQAILDCFNKRELVKIRVNRVDKNDKKITNEIAQRIVENTDIEIVDVIGSTIIMYKKKQRMQIFNS